MQPPAEAAWSRDLRVLQTEPSRSRISSSLASIESQLRSGALNAGPEGGQVVHGTVQLVYALVFGTFGPMLQSVFNLTVLHKRSFQNCQSVMCTISGAMTRLFGGWAHSMSKKEVPMGLDNILKPGMREFYIKIGEPDEEAGTTGNKTFPRFEVALCFVWSCLLKSAERHGAIEHPDRVALVQLLDSWVSIPSGLWGAGRTDAVPGLMDEDAAKIVDDNSGDSPATVDMQALRELKKPLLRQRAAEMGVPADKIEAARDEDDEKGAMIKLILAISTVRSAQHQQQAQPQAQAQAQQQQPQAQPQAQLQPLTMSTGADPAAAPSVQRQIQMQALQRMQQGAGGPRIGSLHGPTAQPQQHQGMTAGTTVPQQQAQTPNPVVSTEPFDFARGDRLVLDRCFVRSRRKCKFSSSSYSSARSSDRSPYSFT